MKTPLPRRAALFLDRDGVIIRDAGYLGDPAGVELLPGARAALGRALKTHRLFVLTNQSGIGRGYFTRAQAEAVNTRMLRLLHLPRPGIERIAMAPERPDEPSTYRKPSPRFLRETIAQEALDPDQCWMVGDRLSDLQAGIRAGIRAALLAPGSEPPDAATRAYCRRHRIPVYASLLLFIPTLQEQPHEDRLDTGTGGGAAACARGLPRARTGGRRAAGSGVSARRLSRR
jgi:D-glycero-D-manno-heptose 1,7-bisphosphate phosphatase